MDTATSQDQPQSQNASQVNPVQPVGSTPTPTQSASQTDASSTQPPIQNSTPVSDGTSQVSAASTTPPPPPAQSDQQGPSVPPSDGGKKPNMLLLSVAVLVVGILTGVSLLAAGLFNQAPLRLGEQTSGNVNQQAVPEEKIIVGTDATYPPMEFTDQNGNLIGYDIDLAGKLGDEMDREIELRNIPFDKLFTALDQDEVDMVISSVTITEERKLKYDFSEPYINAGQVIVTASTAANTMMTPDALKGKRVGVQNGTTSEEEALKYVARAGVIGFADYPEAVKAIDNKRIDAIIVDLTAAKGLIDENPHLRIASDPFTNEYYGVVFRKGDAELRSKVDEVLLSLQKRGVLNDIKQKWFQ